MKNGTSLLFIKKSGFGSSVPFFLSIVSVIFGIICSFKMYFSAAVYNNISIFPTYNFDRVIRNLLSADILILALLSVSFFSGVCVILNYVFLFSASFLNCYTICIFYTCFNSVTTEIAVSSFMVSVGIVFMCHIAAEACKFSLKLLGKAGPFPKRSSGVSVLKIIRIILELSAAAFFIVAAAVILKNGGI